VAGTCRARTSCDCWHLAPYPRIHGWRICEYLGAQACFLLAVWPCRITHRGRTRTDRQTRRECAQGPSGRFGHSVAGECSCSRTEAWRREGGRGMWMCEQKWNIAESGGTQVDHISQRRRSVQAYRHRAPLTLARNLLQGRHLPARRPRPRRRAPPGSAGGGRRRGLCRLRCRGAGQSA
jgi:hypothetical protein